MDSNGRWFQTEISEIETVRPPGGSGGGSKSKVGCAVICPIPVFTTMDRNGTGHLQTVVGEVKAIRVDFSDAGGRDEWIFVDSDRLAPAEKFTRGSLQCMENLELGSNGVSNGSNGSSNQQSKDTPAARQSLILRKNSNSNSNSALLKPSPPTVYSYPGFGACGLTNLGNTCYINSAVQCIGYMPLLRSYLVSGKYRRNGDLNRDNPLGTGISTGTTRWERGARSLRSSRSLYCHYCHRYHYHLRCHRRRNPQFENRNYEDRCRKQKL